MTATTIPPARNPIKVVPTAHPAPHYILQLMNSAGMTALVNTLHNPLSISVTAQSW